MRVSLAERADMMSSNEQLGLYVMGLPNAGKSSFLAAFWMGVSDSQSRFGITLDRLPETNEYLEGLAQAWLECKPPERNPVHDVQKHVLDLIIDHDPISLSIPDLSGESFSSYLSDRVVDSDFAHTARNAMGLLLFIHPDIERPRTVREATVMIDAIGGSTSTDEDEETEADDWDPQQVPTDVALVDLLQIAGKLTTALCLRVSVIVSAWDLVEDQGKSPDEWVAAELPLLYQYLDSDKTQIESKIYGISAQGGEYTSHKQELAGFASPLDRIRVRSDEREDHDITRPVRWLIAGK